jgi:hypothetical protein
MNLAAARESRAALTRVENHMPFCNTARDPSLTVNLAFAAFVLFVFQDANASCGAAFCMVNTNWNIQGFAPEPGLRLDARFEYVDQDQPMTGSRKIAFGHSAGTMTSCGRSIATTSRRLITRSTPTGV